MTSPYYSNDLNSAIEYSQRITRRFVFIICALNLFLPLGIFVYAEATDQSYWRLFRSEGNLTAWFSSIQLLLIAGVAYINYKVLLVSSRVGFSSSSTLLWGWKLFALGFTMLALDERFNFNEALRDELFVPANLFTNLPYIIDGDIGLYLFFLIGLASTLLILQELKNQPLSFCFFVIALMLTLPVIVIDSINDSTLQQWPYWRFWDYTFEEIGEVWAQLLFLLAFLNILYNRLDSWNSFSYSVNPAE